MHTARKRGDAIGALAIVTVDNPMCPGTGHRICNDCMKACIYQKQEPVNIPQVETGVLTDVLKLPFGFEIYGLLTRWNPLNIAAAVCASVQRPERARGRPRSRRLHALALPAQRGLRRRGHRRPQDRAAAGRHRRRASPLAAADPRLVRDLQAARRARAGGVRRRLRVRHHGALGQELPDAHPPHAGAAREVQGVRRRAVRRRPADRGGLGARHRSRRDCGGRRPADDHRHQEQPDSRHPQGQRLPDGAAAHRRVQEGRALEPPGPAARGRHRRRPHRHRHGHRADGLLPDSGGEDAVALRVAGRRDSARTRCAERWTPRRTAILDEFLEHGRDGPGRTGAGEGGRRSPRLHRDDSAVGRRHAGLPQAAAGLARLPPESRGGLEGASRRALRSPRTCPRKRRSPTSFGHVAAMVFTRPGADGPERWSCRRGPCWWPPARRRTSPTRRSTPARSRSTASSGSSRATGP